VSDSIDRPSPTEPDPDDDPGLGEFLSGVDAELGLDFKPGDGGVDGEEQDRPSPKVDGGRLAFEVSDWSGESRRLLDSLLSSSGVEHVWQGTRVTVPARDAETVKAVIDEVLASATPSLDADRTRVVYEVCDWTAEVQTSLAESLAVAEIPYEWNEAGDLVVYADDEDRVDEILEAIPDTGDELEDDDGLQVQQTLSRAFVAAKRIAKKSWDADSIITVTECAERLEHFSVPFGFEPDGWKLVVDSVEELAEMLAMDDIAVSDDEVKELAATVRDRLRPLV
jgi:hypothetical protein